MNETVFYQTEPSPLVKKPSPHPLLLKIRKRNSSGACIGTDGGACIHDIGFQADNQNSIKNRAARASSLPQIQ